MVINGTKLNVNLKVVLIKISNDISHVNIVPSLLCQGQQTSWRKPNGKHINFIWFQENSLLSFFCACCLILLMRNLKMRQ